MRLLALLQGTKPEDHPGFIDAFDKLTKEGILTDVMVMPYFGIAGECGWEHLWASALKHVRETEVDAVFFQFFHSERILNPTTFISKLRDLPHKPTLFVSCGDAFLPGIFNIQ
jgi:hypothetical protein